MRKSFILAICIGVIVLTDALLLMYVKQQRRDIAGEIIAMRKVVRELGLSDLALSTEARYTRHPAVSDGVVPFMDHPADIEHFPSGTFWHPVR